MTAQLINLNAERNRRRKRAETHMATACVEIAAYNVMSVWAFWQMMADAMSRKF